MSDRPASNGMPALLFALTLCALGGGWLLSQTVVRDIKHPSYSTLNDTPRGTRLLFEALSHTSRETVRLFEVQNLPQDATLFRIGEPLSQLDVDALLSDPDESAFVAGGGRLVCAFSGWQPDHRDRPSARSLCETGQCAVASTNLTAAAPRFTRGLSLLALTNLTAGARAAANNDRVPWYSIATFEVTGDATNRWRTLYTLDGHPVMIESRFGKGSLVLATDCYHLSNEALVHDRHTDLIAALVGGSHTVLFDETVHGIRERHNTAWLLQRYRLHLLVAVLALLFFLTLWQHACPLLPRQTGTSDAPQRGFRMEDGLICLLRQHLSAERLPRQLLETWQQTAPKLTPAARDEMLSLVDRAEETHAPPEDTIRALHELANRNSHAHTNARSHKQPFQGDTP